MSREAILSMLEAAFSTLPPVADKVDEALFLSTNGEWEGYELARPYGSRSGVYQQLHQEHGKEGGAAKYAELKAVFDAQREMLRNPGTQTWVPWVIMKGKKAGTGNVFKNLQTGRIQNKMPEPRKPGAAKPAGEGGAAGKPAPLETKPEVSEAIDAVNHLKAVLAGQHPEGMTVDEKRDKMHEAIEKVRSLKVRDLSALKGPLGIKFGSAARDPLLMKVAERIEKGTKDRPGAQGFAAAMRKALDEALKGEGPLAREPAPEAPAAPPEAPAAPPPPEEETALPALEKGKEEVPPASVTEEPVEAPSEAPSEEELLKQIEVAAREAGEGPGYIGPMLRSYKGKSREDLEWRLGHEKRKAPKAKEVPAAPSEAAPASSPPVTAIEKALKGGKPLSLEELLDTTSLSDAEVGKALEALDEAGKLDDSTLTSDGKDVLYKFKTKGEAPAGIASPAPEAPAAPTVSGKVGDFAALVERSANVASEAEGGPDKGMIDLSAAQELARAAKALKAGEKEPLTDALRLAANKAGRGNYPDEASHAEANNLVAQILAQYTPEETRRAAEAGELPFAERRPQPGGGYAWHYPADVVDRSLPAYGKFLQDKLGANAPQPEGEAPAGEAPAPAGKEAEAPAGESVPEEAAAAPAEKPRKGLEGIVDAARAAGANEAVLDLLRDALHGSDDQAKRARKEARKDPEAAAQKVVGAAVATGKKGWKDHLTDREQEAVAQVGNALGEHQAASFHALGQALDALPKYLADKRDVAEGGSSLEAKAAVDRLAHAAIQHLDRTGATRLEEHLRDKLGMKGSIKKGPKEPFTTEQLKKLASLSQPERDFLGMQGYTGPGIIATRPEEKAPEKGMGPEKLKAAPDGAVVGALKGGDPGAAKELTDRYMDKVLKKARHIAADKWPGMKQDADDIAQEAWAKVLNLAARGEGLTSEQAVMPYMATTLQNAFKDAGRKLKQKPGAINEELTPEREQPDRVTQVEHLKKRFGRLLADPELKGNERLVAEALAKHLEAATPTSPQPLNTEIGAQVGLSPQAVGRIRDRISTRLAAQGEDEEAAPETASEAVAPAAPAQAGPQPAPEAEGGVGEKTVSANGFRDILDDIGKGTANTATINDFVSRAGKLSLDDLNALRAEVKISGKARSKKEALAQLHSMLSSQLDMVAKRQAFDVTNPITPWAAAAHTERAAEAAHADVLKEEGIETAPATFAGAPLPALPPPTQPWERSGHDRVIMLQGMLDSHRAPDGMRVAEALNQYAQERHLGNPVGQRVDKLGRELLGKLSEAEQQKVKEYIAREMEYGRDVAVALKEFANISGG